MSLGESLLRLREETSRLNAAADAATQALNVVEEFLNSTNVGFDATVSIGAGFQLAYDKRGSNHYRLMIGEQIQDDQDPWGGPAYHYVPWQESPREQKIKAAAHLQLLVDKISERLFEQTINALDEKTLIEVTRVSQGIANLVQGSKRNAK